jgi:hypothetical protein
MDFYGGAVRYEYKRVRVRVSMGEGEGKHGWGPDGAGLRRVGSRWVTSRRGINMKVLFWKFWDSVFARTELLIRLNLPTGLKQDDPERMMDTDLYRSDLSVGINIYSHPELITSRFGAFKLSDV